MNLIDGSSVWVQSVSQTLTKIEGVEVTLLLRAPEQRDVLTAPLRANPRIELVHPDELGHEQPLDVEAALDALEQLDGERSFDHVFLRGAGICAEAAHRQAFPGRLWSYYLTLHNFQPGQEVDQLRLIAPASERVLCQTEPIRELAMAAVPEQAEKLTLLPPMIPSVAESERRSKPGGLKLVYAGKFAPEYYFLEILDTFRRLRLHPPGCRAPPDRRQDPQPSRRSRVQARGGDGARGDRESRLARWGEPRRRSTSCCARRTSPFRCAIR